MTNCRSEEARAGYISKATAMRLILRNYREQGDITISDGERTATIPGKLGIDTVRDVKGRAATLKTSAEAALERQEE